MMDHELSQADREYRANRKPGQPKTLAKFLRKQEHDAELARKNIALGLPEGTKSAKRHKAKWCSEAPKRAEVTARSSQILSVMRSEAKKRAAPWEGRGNRE